MDVTNKSKRESIYEITKEINEQLSQIGEPNCADKVTVVPRLISNHKESE